MEQIQLIAMRIRDLREISGLSQQAVAEKAGIGLTEYMEYESGAKEPTFSHLFNVAEVLGADISDLLTGESPKLHGYVLTRAGKGLAFERRSQYHYQHLAANFKDKKAEPFIVTVDEDETGAVKQAHSHEGQEFDLVQRGILRIVLGGNELLLREGDSVYYDSSLPHAMYAVGGSCQFVAVVIK